MIRNGWMALAFGLVSVWSVGIHAQDGKANGSNRADELKPGTQVPSLKVPADLELDLLLKEPQVANPLYMTFDERGRMWLVQYRQYPWPAGLKLVSRDNVYRNVYDPPFPPAPPHAADSPFRGADKITIHEDTNGDGRFDKHKTFLEGLNLATAALPGRGGVFVMNPPYLLFYPDRDKDDRPDTNQPRILLSGFGIEDTHSIANSLRWGPDGWIYAAQGSTVSASVRRHGNDNQVIPNEAPVHTMGQNIWRYHPGSHVYEVFAEGGGNAFGVELDSKGRVYSGHNGGNTRGFYYVPGGYYLKNFGKHGSLSNPFAFGYYDAMKHPAVERFTHTFEIYESTELPSRYHGKLFGLAPHLHYTIQSRIFPNGSSRQTRDVGKVIVPSAGPKDNWFTPVDIQTGPDGGLYIADWYSVQVNHYKNHEGQTNPDLGRIYRLRGKTHQFPKPFDLSSLSSRELVEKFLGHHNRWYRETTLRLLGDRKDPAVLPRLRELAVDPENLYALEAVWALDQIGGWTDSVARQLLKHPDPYVRLWTVRLLGENKKWNAKIVDQLTSLAATEPNVEVRLQLACTSRRLSTDHGLRLVTALLPHSEDANDVLIPRMIWWSVEKHADNMQATLAWLSQLEMSRLPLARAANLDANLMRRWAALGKQADLKACASLFQQATEKSRKERLVSAFTRAFEGRTLGPLPDELVKQLSRIKGHFAVVLGVRRGDAEAVSSALKQVNGESNPVEVRVQCLRALGEVQADATVCVPAFVQLLGSQSDDRIVTAALLALQNYPREEIGADIIKRLPQLQPNLQETAQAVLASRVSWARQLVQAVKSEKLEVSSIMPDTLQRLRLHRDAVLKSEVAKQFPDPAPTAKQLDQRIEVVERIVRKGNGRPLVGQKLYYEKANCGKCHQIFGKGGDVGPGLTAFNRNNLRLMLLAVVHPSAEIREGYENLTVWMDDGQVLTGFKVDENSQILVLRSADGQNHKIEKNRIDEQTPNKRSLMPDGLLDSLTDDELRDLFAFLTSTTPPK